MPPHHLVSSQDWAAKLPDHLTEIAELLIPDRTERTCPRAVKRARHNNYRVKKPGEPASIRHTRAATISPSPTGRDVLIAGPHRGGPPHDASPLQRRIPYPGHPRPHHARSGFDGADLMVAGSTGTGWLDPAAMATRSG